MASNGIGDLGQFDFMNKGMYPGSQIDRSYYSSPSQVPLGAQAALADYDPETNPLTGEPASRFAKGGIATLHYDGTEGSQVEEPEDPFLGNKDFQNLSFSQMQDTDRLNSLNALKESNPDQYKSQLMGMLGESLKEQYNINADYEPTWKQFQSLQESNPEQWHKHQLDWLGHQQGWQVGQNTSDRNTAGLPAIQNEIEQAKKAGIAQEEIDSILGRSNQAANIQNQNRIINESQAGHGPLGMTTQDYLTVAAILGSGAAAAYFAPAAGASGGFGLNAAGTGATFGSLSAPAAGATYGGLSAGALGTGVPAGLTIAEGTALAGTGAGALAAETAGGTGGLTAAEMAAGSGTPATSGLPAGQAFTNAELAAGSGTPLTSGLPSSSVYGPAYSELGYVGAGTPETAAAIAEANAASAAAAEGGMTTKQLMAANMGLKTLAGAMGGASGQGGTTGTSGTPQMQAPQQQYIQPTMLAQPKYGELYRPYTYDYTRHAAQGGVMYADGGGIPTLGSYSDGGRLLKGPGDGMSDDIPAHIGGDQPAALADGEFVIPADVVSHLGNGSTDAGAKQLYKMMDKIRHARTGNSKQGKQINPDKFLPKG